MPVLMHIPATTHFCRKCGWSITQPSYTQGDVIITPHIFNLFLLNACPECGHTDIGSRKASWADRLNPLTYVRWTRFQIRNIKKP